MMDYIHNPHCFRHACCPKAVALLCQLYYKPTVLRRLAYIPVALCMFVAPSQSDTAAVLPALLSTMDTAAAAAAAAAAITGTLFNEHMAPVLAFFSPPPLTCSGRHHCTAYYRLAGGT
jgi:hypothetical protein